MAPSNTLFDEEHWFRCRRDTKPYQFETQAVFYLTHWKSALRRQLIGKYTMFQAMFLAEKGQSISLKKNIHWYLPAFQWCTF